MQTMEAIYDNGKLIFLSEELKIRAKVRLTVIEELTTKIKKRKLPELHLGVKGNLDRKELYDEYLSD
ncbi:MAG: hypothetical protein V1779_01755 [bacterium]